MKKKKSQMSRAFIIDIYSELHSGKSYPQVAEEREMAYTEAFRIFHSVEETVEKNGKLKLRIACHMFSKAPEVGDKTFDYWNSVGIFTYDDFLKFKEEKGDIKGKMSSLRKICQVRTPVSDVVYEMLKGATL